jgi:hypothetical protein
MDTVTYPDQKVAAFIQEEMVPIRVASNAVPLSKDFNIKWTPALMVLDTAGKEHYRTIGFIPPEELTAPLLLGMGKACFDLDELKMGMEDFNRIIESHPQSYYTPEAIYLRGVSLYKDTHEVRHLKEIYRKLHDEYPESLWTSRALPYRLL